MPGLLEGLQGESVALQDDRPEDAGRGEGRVLGDRQFVALQGCLDSAAPMQVLPLQKQALRTGISGGISR